jgi:hypothetical protein
MTLTPETLRTDDNIRDMLWPFDFELIARRWRRFSVAPTRADGGGRMLAKPPSASGKILHPLVAVAWTWPQRLVSFFPGSFDFASR